MPLPPSLGGALRRFLAARAAMERSVTVVYGCRTTARRVRRPPDAAIPGAVGPGPAVVVLAGLALSGRYLLPLAALLGRRRPVWALDLPGYGRTQGPRRTLDLPELADFVAGWMDVMGIARAVLVGNSMGCQIAVEVAARHPDRVVAVVLEGPTVDAAARTVPRQVARVAVDAFGEPLSLWFLQLFDWLGTGPARVLGTVRRAFAHRVEDVLPLVRCPALVVRGGRDPIAPQRWVEQVAAALPAGALHVVPHGTHAMSYAAPEALAAVVEAFLEKEIR